jgi:hypothetical protein
MVKRPAGQTAQISQLTTYPWARPGDYTISYLIRKQFIRHRSTFPEQRPRYPPERDGAGISGISGTLEISGTSGISGTPDGKIVGSNVAAASPNTLVGVASSTDSPDIVSVSVGVAVGVPVGVGLGVVVAAPAEAGVGDGVGLCNSVSLGSGASVGGATAVSVGGIKVGVGVGSGPPQPVRNSRRSRTETSTAGMLADHSLNARYCFTTFIS